MNKDATSKHYKLATTGKLKTGGPVAEPKPTPVKKCGGGKVKALKKGGKC